MILTRATRSTRRRSPPNEILFATDLTCTCLGLKPSPCDEKQAANSLSHCIGPRQFKVDRNENVGYIFRVPRHFKTRRMAFKKW